jgi:ribosomal protein S18 acetylase RimI-like enzyme
MIMIRPLTTADGALLKHFRLTALQDTPTAFGSSFAREAALSDDEWQSKAAAWNNGQTSTCMVAMDDESTPAGIAAGYVSADSPGVVSLVSMWVSTKFRRRGIGRKLVEAVELWARQIGSTTIQLTVTEGNTAAESLYREMGFVPTGERGPHQAHPGEIVYTMAKPLSSLA